jgi:hypothetical protein
MSDVMGVKHSAKINKLWQGSSKQLATFKKEA